jgi:hypothetical protein
MNRPVILVACLMLCVAPAFAADREFRLEATARQDGKFISVSARLLRGSGGDAETLAAPALMIEPGHVGWAAIGTRPAASGTDAAEPMHDGIHLDAISIAHQPRVLVVARQVEAGLVVFAQAVEVPVEPAP